jgi:predicted aspartyl protease
LKKAIFPAIALFSAAALGLVSLRDTMDDSLDAKPAVARATTDEPDFAKVTPHQIRTASLRKEGDGHYWATARVNGQPG